MKNTPKTEESKDPAADEEVSPDQGSNEMDGSGMEKGKDALTASSNNTCERLQEAKQINRAVIVSETVAAAKEAEANKRLMNDRERTSIVRNAQEADRDAVAKTNTQAIDPAAETTNEQEDILGSIQLLPDQETERQARPPSSPQIGAYAVLAPRYVDDGVGTTQNAHGRRPGSQDGSDIEAGSSAVFSNDDQDELVEAELVDSDVVMAEKVKDGSQTSRKLSPALIVGGFVISALIATVVALLVGKDGDSGNSVASNADNTSTNSSTDEEGSDPGPCSPFASFNKQSFNEPNELFAAVSSYLRDPSPTSNVSQKYGWPIGNWCVGNIDNFNYVLDTSQEREAFGNFSAEVLLRASQMHFDIGNWDMSNAWKMEDIFRNAQNLSANWGIQKWDISSLGDMEGAFKGTQWTEPMLDLSNWDTKNVWSMAALFKDSTVETPGIANWNTAKLEQMYGFAESASHFNEDIGNWNTNKVFSLQKAFRNAKSFNQDLSRWNTKSLKKLNMAFWGAESFNQELNAWDTSSVQTMHDTFQNSAFNQDISQWNVTKVTTMARMFKGSAFNQDISEWKVTSAIELEQAFDGAANFSQNLCAWGSRLPPNARTKNMFLGTACPNTSDPLGPQGPFCFNCDRRSFQSKEELFDAVTMYLEDSSPTSNVSHLYGWPIGTWQVSGVSKFTGLFATDESEARNLTGQALNKTEVFQADIGDWDMRGVSELGETFSGMKNLSASWGIDRWDTSSIKVLRNTFLKTKWTEPKLSLSSWDVSGVRGMGQTFRLSDVDVAGVANWDTSKVDNLYQVFGQTNNFNEDIGGWNTGKVKEMHYAFQQALSFNQDLSGWNTSSVTQMAGAFKSAASFNAPLWGWDVSKVKGLHFLFFQTPFNQDISSWDVSNAQRLGHTFRESGFNQDISNWNVSSVTELNLAFMDAKNFSQNLCAWGSRLPSDAKVLQMFKGTACPNTSDPVIPGGPFCFNCE